MGILDRDADGTAAVEATLRDAGATARAHVVDITDAGAVEAAVAALEAEIGPTFGLVNNAGWDLAHELSRDRSRRYGAS